MPRYEPGDQPGSFRLLEETRLHWPAIVDAAYQAVGDDTPVASACATIAEALPPEVRHAEYGWLGPAGTTASFRAFSEIAFRELATTSLTSSGVTPNTSAAAIALDRFVKARRHCIVQTRATSRSRHSARRPGPSRALRAERAHGRVVADALAPLTRGKAGSDSLHRRYSRVRSPALLLPRRQAAPRSPRAGGRMVQDKRE
jgi:hypothetical protein